MSDPLNALNALDVSSDTLLGEITLTDEQQHAIDLIITWLHNPSTLEFKLGGYAGTGKTTIIKVLLAGLTTELRPAVAAFTGKACHVLRKKGVLQAQTIHSLIYDVEEDKDGSVSFSLRTRLPNNPRLIIIDEASMISSDLYRDLKSFNIKLLFIGDPGQLEPIGDNPNLMKSPDYVLSKIHRQAEKSPIITLASAVRGGSPIRINDSTGIVTIKPRFITDDELASVDQVLCAKNATRSILNRRVRSYLGRLDRPLVEGEKIICLRNNRRFFMFNGLICTVDKINNEYQEFWQCTLRDEADKLYHNIPIWKLPFQRELSDEDKVPGHMIYCDYAYAITVHKSQGSEWDHVLVYDEVMYKCNMMRWRYTAITRAAQKLTYLIN